MFTKFSHLYGSEIQIIFDRYFDFRQEAHFCLISPPNLNLEKDMNGQTKKLLSNSTLNAIESRNE